MESKASEPCEGENINYSHTPDGHERAGPRPISEDFVRNVVRSLESTPKVEGGVASGWHLRVG